MPDGLGVRIGSATTNLAVNTAAMTRLINVDEEEWRQEISRIHNHYARFGHKLAAELRAQLDRPETRLRRPNLSTHQNADAPRTTTTPQSQTIGRPPRLPRESAYLVSYAP
jgi:hypothetical protein